MKDLQQKLNFFPFKRIQFDKVDLCLLPREAVLLVQICSSSNLITSNLNISSNSSYSIQNKSTSSMATIVQSSTNMPIEEVISASEQCWAWASKSFFNDELLDFSLFIYSLNFFKFII